jgi:glycosyltransferase domain-containing protein
VLNYKKLAKLTLVMPSYERQPFVIRSMKYWSNKNVKLVVLDGSECSIKSSILKTLNLNKNIYYEHSKSSFVKRLKRAIILTKTKYVALIGDDEFYIPSTLLKCIDELDKNNKLVSCCGTAVGFYPFNGLIYGKLKYPKLLGYKIHHNDPRERVKFHMRNYVPSLVYGVTRSHQWKTATSAYTDKEFPVFAMFEIQMEMILSFCGKSKVIPSLMWLRSGNESDKINHKEKSLNPKNIFPKWWKNKKIKNQHEKFISIVSKKFSLLNPGFKNEYYSKSVIDACKSYIVFSLERKSRRQLSILHRLARYFISFVSEDFARKIKNIFFTLVGKSNLSHDLLTQKVLRMKETGQRIDLKEVKNIINIITNFHNEKFH